MSARQLRGKIIRFILKIYARLERPLLLLNFWLVKSPLARWPLTRPLLWGLFFKPVSELGAAGQPLAPAEAAAYIRQAAANGAIAVGPCGCRTVHHGCNHPTRTDIVVYAGVEAWSGAFPAAYEQISAEEAIAIMEECHKAGMIQVLYRSGMGGGQGYAICNCCMDGCLPLLNKRAYPGYRFYHGRYVARVDPARCTGCGLCAEICPFNTRRAGWVGDCYGCGLCASHCPQGAVEMVERAEVED